MNAISLVFPGLIIDSSELLLLQAHCPSLAVGRSKSFQRDPSFLKFNFYTNWESLFFLPFVGFKMLTTVFFAAIACNFFFLTPKSYIIGLKLRMIYFSIMAIISKAVVSPRCPVFSAGTCWWLCNVISTAINFLGVFRLPCWIQSSALGNWK